MRYEVDKVGGARARKARRPATYLASSMELLGLRAFLHGVCHDGNTYIIHIILLLSH